MTARWPAIVSLTLDEVIRATGPDEFLMLLGEAVVQAILDGQVPDGDDYRLEPEDVTDITLLSYAVFDTVEPDSLAFEVEFEPHRPI